MSLNIELDRELAEYRQKFFSLYPSKILPILAKFEKERKQKLHQFILCVTISILSFSIELFFGIKGYLPIPIFYILLTISVLLGCSQISVNYDFAKKIKHVCMRKIVSTFKDLSWYDKRCLISDNELKNSCLFPTFAIRESYDAFRGRYKNVTYEIEETYFCNPKNLIFQGVLVKFPSNKKVKTTLTVFTKGYFDDINNNTNDDLILAVVFAVMIFALLFLAIYRNIDDVFLTSIIIFALIIFLVFKIFIPEPKKSLNEIKLESPEFSKKYKVYSADQIEGRYLITPAFMVRLENLKTAFGAKNVKCSFNNNSLIFALSTPKNLFEIGDIFHSLENPKQMTVFFNELASILVLIDHFKLDERTGL